MQKLIFQKFISLLALQLLQGTELVKESIVKMLVFMENIL
jgi:hypothetical protein